MSCAETTATGSVATTSRTRVALVPTADIAELVGEIPDDSRVALWEDYELGVVDAEDVEFIVLAGGPSSSRGRLHEFPNLKGVRIGSIGHDWIVNLVPSGVPVFNSARVMTDTTAETGALGIIASLRGLPEHLGAQRESRWIDHTDRSPEGHGVVGVVGARIAVVGQGGVGRGIADRLEAFRAEVIRFARTARTLDDGTVIHGQDELEAWLPELDAVALALPWTPETDGLVDAEFLAKMRPGAVLGNVGRGRVVDTDALVAACAEGRVRAALDVVDPEPLPAEHPLWTTRGVLITPHTGASSRNMAENRLPDLAGSVTSFLRSEDLGAPVLVG